jgi:hypothetical protein
VKHKGFVVRRNLKEVSNKPACRWTRTGLEAYGDEECHALSQATAQAQGERSKERGGTTGNAEILGFSFSNNKEPKRRISPKTLLRCKQKIRELTRRTRGISLEQMVKELTAYLRGWKGYFGYCQTPSVLQALDQWIRRRLRSTIWKGWKRGPARFRQLRTRGVRASLLSLTRSGVATALGVLLTVRRCIPRFPRPTFDSLGLPVSSTVLRNLLNRRTRTRFYGGLAGAIG